MIEWSRKRRYNSGNEEKVELDGAEKEKCEIVIDKKGIKDERVRRTKTVPAITVNEINVIKKKKRT